MSKARLSTCMLISHRGHTDTIHVYSVTIMTHVKALQAGHSSQGTSEPITPVTIPAWTKGQRGGYVKTPRYSTIGLRLVQSQF